MSQKIDPDPNPIHPYYLSIFVKKNLKKPYKYNKKEDSTTI